MTTAELSNTLFHVALFTYLTAMVAGFFALAFTRVSARGELSASRAGALVGRVGLALTFAGFAVHLASVVLRGVAAARVPWGNMYEYGSGMALIAVGAGLVVLLRRRLEHLLAFVLAAALLMMVSSLLLFADAGPLVPALESYWLKIHVSAMMGSSAVLIVAFVATVLYLVKDTAERRVAATGTFGPRSLGAAHAGSAVPGRIEVEEDPSAAAELEASPLAQRDTLNPLAFPLVPGVVAALFTFAVWRSPVAAMAAASVAALLGAGMWYAVPYLPPAARLDDLAYRVTAFGFPLLTFGVLCGAIWAEEAWGRYWGWDPKETGSFVTWVLYAAYLHARSTHGWRGARAGWVGVIAFAALMVTYYAVNLFVVGLHSYAGV